MTEKQIKVRIESELHAWLKTEAAANRRSMSAEIAARLDQQRQRDQRRQRQQRQQTRGGQANG